MRIARLLYLSLFVFYALDFQAQNDCAKVSGLAVSKVSEHSAKLTWEGDTNHREFRVDVKHGAQAANFAFSRMTSATEVTVDGLVPGSNYRFRVMAKCDKGSGGSSKWFDFATVGEKPGDGGESDGQGKCPDIQELTAIDVSDTGATLSWLGNESHRSYKVDVIHAPQNPNFKWSTRTSDTAVTLTNLSPGRTYRFKVQVSCAKGKSNSGWHTFTTTGVDSSGHGRCPKASNLAVLDVTDSSVVLSWLGNPENVVYLVDVHQKEHTAQYRLSEIVDTTILAVEGLEPGGNYKFRVKAECERNKAGSSSWINFVTTGGDSTYNQCPKPRNLSVLEVSDTSALLNWVPRDSFTSFHLNIKSIEGTQHYAFDTTLTDTFFLATDLSPDGNYHFRVVTECSDTSTSGSSDWSKFRTLAEDANENIVEATPEFEASIATFPNPVEDNFMVELPLEDIGFRTTITLVNLDGQVVSQRILEETPKSPLQPLDVKGLRPGLYKLVVRSVGGFEDHQTIIVR
ncbi:MAG: hypothetical protein HKN87_22035 [Saprospiraceae bacterium]|nr:hypothetical protein [Saprospiraceae bacterium]